MKVKTSSLRGVCSLFNIQIWAAETIFQVNKYLRCKKHCVTVVGSCRGSSLS